MASLIGTAYYAFVRTPKPKQGKFPANFSLDVVLDDSQQKKAKELGLTIKEPRGEITGKHVNFKSYVDNDDHKKCVTEGGRKPQVFLNKSGNPVPYNGPIWQGSKVNAVFGLYQYDGGVKPILRAVQVLELGPAPEGWEDQNNIDKELIRDDLNDDINSL